MNDYNSHILQNNRNYSAILATLQINDSAKYVMLEWVIIVVQEWLSKLRVVIYVMMTQQNWCL
jgi:hypothetical protein